MISAWASPGRNPKPKKSSSYGGAFLREELKLELSETKTLITHARSEAAKFLGYELTILQKDTKRTKNKVYGTKRRSINGGVGLRVPRTVIRDKCDRYKQHNKVMHRTELLNESDYTIIATYQLECARHRQLLSPGIQPAHAPTAEMGDGTIALKDVSDQTSHLGAENHGQVQS